MKANVTAYLNFRYEKVRLLKQNEKSEVWLALNKSTNQPVILKKINYTGLPYAALKENPHALFAQVFYCAESEIDTVIVEEFLPGETLSQRKKLLTEQEARAILIQMCDGLKFLHALGIIHRDIKPSNLILQSGGQIRLIDFDAARIVKENQAADTKLLGTKGYAPPEQFGFGQTDSRSDIYSLGKTLLELTGENCGSKLKKILSKCIEVDPKNRYQNVDELKAALTKKNSPFAKICASLAAVFTGIFLFFNSTDGKNIPAEIEKVPETENIPAEIEKIPETKIENPVENETPAPNSNLEKLQPLPSNSLENFQPSFPTLQQYNFELEFGTTTQNLGGVQLGDSLENIRVILGDEEEIKSYEGLNFVNHFFRNLNVTIENNLVTCITTKNSDVSTLKGIKQGDSLEKVLAAYGNHYETRQFGNTTVYIYPYKLIHGVNQNFSTELRFTVENNLVTAITLMTTD
ncbi:MAG: serine/threonine protein kinase [Selenomonadaceae bacterium]|nr:serine/threonine protein kinase [Selenomonadaceae bacterium]